MCDFMIRCSKDNIEIGGLIHENSKHKLNNQVPLYMYMYLFSLFKPPEERCDSPHVHCMAGHCQSVVQNPRNLTKHCTNVLCPDGNIDPQQFLNGQGVCLLVAHHGDIVQAVKVRQTLDVGLVLHQLLCAAMEQADMWITAKNSL